MTNPGISQKVALPDVASVAAAEATVRRLLAGEAFPALVRKACAGDVRRFRNATSTDYQVRIDASTSWVRPGTELPGEWHHPGGSRDIEVAAAAAVPSSARAAVSRFDGR